MFSEMKCKGPSKQLNIKKKICLEKHARAE